MSNEPRARRPLTDQRPSLSPAVISSTSSSSFRGSRSESQHLIIRTPSRHKRGTDPHYIPDPGQDIKRRIRVYSWRDKSLIDVEAIFARDFDGPCWISEETVKRLDLRRRPMGNESLWGSFARKTFNFCGETTLVWFDGRSKPTESSIFPGNVGIEAEVIFQRDMLPPACPQESTMRMLPSVSNYMQPTVEDVSPSETSPSSHCTGTFDGGGLADFAEFMDDSSNEAKAADRWMLSLKSDVHEKRRSQQFIRDRDTHPIRIAVLDTGVDLHHNYIKGCKKANRIKGMRSFVTDDEEIDDHCGHGTHIAALLLKVAPDCQIYVAKVATSSQIPPDHRIAEALEWAIEQKVDIISMSFGMDNDHPEMQAQILRAYSEDIIMFAAASNRGQNYGVTFPARANEVICVYSTDGNGAKSRTNPPPLPNKGYHFATVGIAVKSSWPRDLPLSPDTITPAEGGISAPTQQYSKRQPVDIPPLNKSPERRMTGTSFATPILAAIAAFVLDFARIHGISQPLYRRLRSPQGMQEVFAERMAVQHDGLCYICPWKLFGHFESNANILVLIENILRRGVAGSGQAGSVGV